MNDTLENGTNSSIRFFSPKEEDILIATGSIQLILILPFNGYVLWLILSGAGGGTITSELYYLNLIISVIIHSLASVFYFVFQFTRNFHFLLINIFVFDVFTFSVPSFQCCICVERYIAVVHPVAYLRYKPLRYRVACCCFVWLMVFAFSFGYVLEVLPTRQQCYIYLAIFTASISVMSFCCLSVLRALKQSGPGEGQRDGGGEGNNMKRRAFKIILISLIVMLVTVMSYIPYMLCALLNHNGLYMFVTYAIASMSGFVQPLLHIHKVGKLPCLKAF